MDELTKEAIKHMQKVEGNVKGCSTCGSQPIVDFNKQQRKFVIKCPQCKDMFVMSTLLDAAKKRWDETVTWRTRVNEVYEHNKKVMERIAKGGVIRLPAIY